MKNIMIPQKKIFNPLLLFTFLLFLCLMESVPGHKNGMNFMCRKRERQALLDFKKEIVDDCGRLTSWGIGENKMECCKWRGVHCNNRTNHVDRLNLRAPATSGGDLNLRAPAISGGDFYYTVDPLKGKISSSLLELKHLTYLDLSGNDFGRSQFPEFIGSLGQLQYLYLSHANLSGLIPQCVGNISKLIHLNVGGNYGLYGTNLDWMSQLPSLEYLDLSFVDLNKVTNWLQAITQLRSIRALHLRQCLLHLIPSSFPSINATARLAMLDLSYNILPTSFIYWLSNYNRSLEHIDFSYQFDMGDPNQLDSLNMIRQTHRHPFGNGSSLIYLDLTSTRLTGQFSQLIMDLFGPLESKLRYLYFSFNMLNGSLPDMSRFSFLTHLMLHDNQLNGFLSKDLLIHPSLQILDLSSNQIMGYINAHLHPFPDMSRFSFLKVLDLRSNNLTGFALTGLKFPYLRHLDLSENQIMGPLPDSIGGLSELEVLSIGSNRLEGTVTEACMFNLSRLRILDLSFNPLIHIEFNHLWTPPFQLQVIYLKQCKIGPRFPEWLRTQDAVVFLDISDSNIRDTIPSWFGELASHLVHLDASNNEMYGAFPNISISTHKSRVSYTPSFKALSGDFGVVWDVSRNKISDSLAFLCRITSWSFINLSDNMLYGKLPNCFASFGKLEYLNLINNNLSGTIPYSFGSLQGLRWLGLRNNSVSGRIPESLSNCSNLQIIDLGENRLIGDIPAWIGRSLRMIAVLSLRSNEFIGSIPSSLCGLQNLQILDLSSNKISGTIPKCICNLSAMTIEHRKYKNSVTLIKGYGAFSLSLKNRESILSLYEELLGVYLIWKRNEVKYNNSEGLLVNLIDLSNNALSGEIPDETTKLVGLHALDLSRNNLSGRFPDNIALLKSLEFLDLSWNHISDSIPAGLSEMDSLGVLNLSYNNLYGKIPTGLLKFDASSYIGNSLLCGRPILSTPCPGDDETYGDPNNAMNNVRHEENEFITTGFYISVAAGFVTGFWGIIGTIIANKSFRHAVFRITNDVTDYIYVFAVLRKNRLQRYFTNK